MKRVRSLWRRFTEPAPGQTARKTPRRTVRQSVPTLSLPSGSTFGGYTVTFGNGVGKSSAGWSYLTATVNNGQGTVYLNGQPARWNGTHWVI